mmetsp:Transcript_59321/g.98278  ORF Transcript_59321/g.98278 Transcript_59321/m.98278 type:complete len:269 (-) Transcript_59321:191-997(-)
MHSLRVQMKQTKMQDEVKHAYDFFEPVWSCETQERLPWAPGDGPKWVCGVRALENKECLAYSIGSNGDVQFESAIKAIVPGCHIFTFDPTLEEDTPLWERFISIFFSIFSQAPSEAPSKIQRVLDAETRGILKFHAFGIAGRDGRFNWKGRSLPVLSLASIMSRLGHENRSIDVLKIDVEGSEHSTFSLIDPKLLHRVGQLQLEIHGTDFEQILTTMRQIETGGMMLFSKEPNVWGCNGYSCMEFSFVSPIHAFRAFRMSHPSCRPHR